MQAKEIELAVPRVAIRSIGIGLCLMAFFTLVWNALDVLIISYSRYRCVSCRKEIE
jgi:hypothetical protein